MSFRSSAWLRSLLLSCAIAAGLSMLGSRAEAQEELPQGRFGVISGLRQNRGDLGDAYGVAWLIGIEAGYHVSVAETRWSMGVSWMTLFRGWYLAADDSLVDRTITASEMSFGARIRRQLLANVPLFSFVSGGGSFLRLGRPLPPENERRYIGPYAGLGIEQFILGRGYLSLEGRAEMLSGGPASASLFLSFSAGSLE